MKKYKDTVMNKDQYKAKKQTRKQALKLRKKGSASVLFGCICFLALLTLFANQLLSSQSQQMGAYNNTANRTETFINGTQTFNPVITQTSICAIPVNNANPFDLIAGVTNIINSIPLINCITGFSFFLFSFQGFNSTIGWLQIFIWATLVTIFYIAIKVLRGGG